MYVTNRIKVYVPINVLVIRILRGRQYRVEERARTEELEGLNRVLRNSVNLNDLFQLPSQYP